MIVKVYKQDVMEQRPHEAIGYTACQILNYTKNLTHPILKGYMAKHLNFDQYTDTARDIIKDTRNEDHQVRRIKEILSKQQKPTGCVVASYIPNPFSKTEPAYKKLADLFKAAEGTSNDISFNNVREDANENLYLIDLMEESDKPFSVMKNPNIRSFIKEDPQNGAYLKQSLGYTETYAQSSEWDSD